MCQDSERNKCKCCDGCGCIGPQGPQGVPGIQGPQGIQGPAGLNGQNGSNGAQGTQGIQGPSGADGSNGAQGPQGSQGQTGPMGSQGPMGAQGNPGPMGLTGPMGPLGPQGVQGNSGSDGKDGSQGPSGPQGVQGLIGPEGPQGLQGPAGQDCSCKVAYLNIFTEKDQTIPPMNSPTMEMLGITSGALDFDITNASTTGEVKILKHGVYSLSWAVDGKLTPPYPFPVPAWSFAIYRNGVLINSTSSGAFSITPDDLIVHDAADSIIEIFAGDVIKIVNTSTMSVNVVSNPTGSLITISSVRLNLNMIKHLP